MMSDEELEQLEPQVTSSDPNVRKLARALRIQRRIEAIKKQNEPLTQEEEEAKRSSVEVQILKSAQQLENLLIEGEELITNIRVGNDGREVVRRDKESEQRSILIKQIEDEVTEAEKNYQEIEERWIELLLQNDPLDIHDGIAEQKDHCKDLIKQKDSMIASLREEVDRMENEFEYDQIQQKEDIEMLASRMDKQVELMKSAYRNELKLIETASANERLKIMEENLAHWNELYKQRNELEEKNMINKNKQQDQFLYDLKTNRDRNEELYRATKIALENENEVLQQELEHLKAFCLLNGEKLDYNYQIIKRREDENLIIRAQQKRIINKLRDEFNSLRSKGDQYKKNSEEKAGRIRHEIKRLRNSVFSTEAKADLLKQTSEKKYQEVWQYNEDLAREKLSQIFTIDRIIYEQLLGVDWVRITYT